MDGYLDKGRGGVTELRVHGVSGTPPEDMLENPHVSRVSGDGTAGFYRRLWLGGKPPDDSPYADVPKRRREAYSWGGLTSGAGSRALWMLLLPFMLANVAFWMYPAPTLPGENKSSWPGRLRSVNRDLSSALQRLFSLSLTVALTLSAVGVATDLAGWQCAGSDTCLANHGFLNFLTLSFFRQPSRRLAVATVVPLAVVALLWWLGRKSWNAYERLHPAPGETQHIWAIGRRRMWNGAEPVRRLQSLHVCAAFATAGILLVAPLASGPHRLARVVATIVLVLLLLGLCGPVIALLVPRLWRREEPTQSRPHRQLQPVKHDIWFWLPWGALILVVVSVAGAFVPGVGPATSAGSLPWISGFLGWLFGVQMGLLVLVLAVVAVAAVSSRGRDRQATAATDAALPGRALIGLGTPVMLLLSWALTASLAAGLVLRSGGFLGTPSPAGRPAAPRSALLVPAPYYWAAAGAFCLVAVTVLAILVAALPVWPRVAALARDKIARTYVSEHLDRPDGSSADVAARAKEIARSWTLASLTDKAQLVLAVMAVVMAAAAVAGLLGYNVTTVIDGRAVRGMWLWQHASWLATAGSWAVGAFVVALIGLGRRAYSDPGTRRTVGILWDLGTFWPRATHPLAPPCYCERTLPELIDRIAWLAPDEKDVVVLSTHSQGTVIGAALVLQLDPAERARTAFLRYGSPLRRLYCRFFPAYFGAEVLRGIGTALIGTALTAPAPAGQDDGGQDDGRGKWPWRNLFRASDPIGGPIFTACLAEEDLYEAKVLDTFAAGGQAGGDNNDVDRQFLDPVFGRTPGNMAYPPTLRHSGYFGDPYYRACLDKVIELARQRPPGKASTAGPATQPDQQADAATDARERPEPEPDEAVSR